MIGKMVAMLLADRTRWQLLLADRSLIRSAVEEALRADVNRGMMPRFISEDIQVGDTTITAGTTNGGPNIAVKGIKPFGIGGPPTQTIDFPEQTLTNQTNFRTSGAGLTGITQQMVNNPNSVLTAAIASQHITSTTTLHVTTIDLPTPGGGTANTAFLKGGADGPNATAVSVTATFWLETLQGQSAPTQLQYTQTVLLNFNGISWPHVTVATLHKQ